MTDQARKRWTVIGLMLGLLLSALDQTITATAMPTIISSLGGMALYSWVFSIYMLTTTSSIPIFGKLADLYGRRKIYLIGMGLFVLGSALCGLAANMIQLVAFRGIQGMGAGALMPLAMTIIGDIFPPHQRGKMQGLIGAVFGISSIAGPAIGGFITENLNWHWVFFVNLPFGILAAVILAYTLKETKSDKKPVIDWVGAFTLTAAIISLLMITVFAGNNESAGSYSWNSPQIIALIILSIVLTGLFIFIEKRAVEPIIPLHLFKIRVISISSIVGFFSAVGMFGAVTYIPLFAQGVIGVSPSIAGYILTPMMLSMVTSSVIGGLLLTRLRLRSIMVFSMICVSAGLFLLSQMTVNTHTWEIALYMILLGVGMGPLMPMLTVAVQDAVGFNQRGAATSTVTFFRMIGGALGVTILGAIMTARMNGLNAQSLLRPEIRSQMPAAVLEDVTQVLAIAVSSVFAAGLIFVVLGLFFSFFMENKKIGSREPAKMNPESSKS